MFCLQLCKQNELMAIDLINGLIKTTMLRLNPSGSDSENQFENKFDRVLTLDSLLVCLAQTNKEVRLC